MDEPVVSSIDRRRFLELCAKTGLSLCAAGLGLTIPAGVAEAANGTST